MLELINIKKDYFVDKKPYPALKDITLAFADKGFVSILGPSGCGKTTMLNIIGGLDHYSSGDLLIDKKSTKSFSDADWDAYRNERVGFVFQSYNLIPHQSVLSNVETGLMLNGVSRNERIKRASEALKKVGLEGAEKKKPNQLSGGQMQRVALARALVNNPRIILADEPTGALDSVTSKQVMDLLKEVSETRLVIMVTHNENLANEYSDRIIQMKDGVVIGDSNPVEIEKGENIGKEINKKTSMSFLTALKSSFSNIRTKRTRTILTAIASSIGIIGVALVLAVSNGFSNYVSKVESSVAGAVPISITPVTYTYKLSNDSYEQFPDDKEVKIYDSSSETSTIHQNRFTADYISYIEKAVDKGWASSILYNRQNLSFNLMTSNPDGSGNAMSINQYRSAGTVSNAVGSVTGLPSTIFHELYGSSEETSKSYDCIAGRMPQSKDEIVLITDRYNRVEKSTLVSLGIISSTTQEKTISFDDIVYKDSLNEGKTYKVYRNSDLFKNVEYKEEEIQTYEISTNAPSSIADLKNFDLSTFKFEGKEITAKLGYFEHGFSINEVYSNDSKYNPLKLKIVGVIRPSKDSYISLMPSSLGFTTELKNYLADDGATLDTDALLIETHNNLMKAAKGALYYSTDSSKESGKSNSLELLNQLVQKTIKEGKLDEIIAKFKEGSNLSSEDMSSLSTTMTNFFSGLASCLTYRNYWGAYNEATDSYSPGFTNYGSYFSHCQNVGADLMESEIGISGFTNTDGLMKLLAKMMSSSFWNDISNVSRTSWCLIDFLALQNNFSIITSILIFPASLTTKEDLTKYLDAYNSGKSDVDQVTYSDVMSTFTTSLGVLIQVISVVLIVFASISLVVSSIMTGIITYVSVVERTKEIGILRACGARKKDVGRLFQAECVIVGGLAGIIGVGFSWIMCFPISAIIDGMYPGNGLDSIASLSPWHALILVVVAVILAFISGLVPARIAAKKDPVIALRSE